MNTKPDFLLTGRLSFTGYWSMPSADRPRKRQERAPGFEWQNDWHPIATSLETEQLALWKLSCEVTGLNQSKILRRLAKYWIDQVFGLYAKEEEIRINWKAMPPAERYRRRDDLRELLFQLTPLEERADG
jgi:hypothetical protein